MAEFVCPPITVEGDWSPAQTRTVTNKLQIYFGSKKKSGGGGDCRVDADSGAARAAVFFSSAEARERVLARKDHEIVVDKQVLKLRLSSAQVSVRPDGSAGSAEAQTVPGGGASNSGQNELKAVSRTTIVLDNIQSSMSSDLLAMLVEHMSGLDESKYSMEILWEASAAVVTFYMPADVQKFQSNQRLQSQGLTVRLLEEALSVRVEKLPPSVVEDMLKMYFEDTWSKPDKVIMIAAEQAAIVSFTDPEVVKSICTKQSHDIKSTTVKVYPYYLSLGSALYGMDRPTCQPPKAFTEKVPHAIWEFLLLKKLSKSINDQMVPCFCSVDLQDSEVKLSPLPSFMRQPGVNGNMVDKWKKSAQEAFRQLLSDYVAFECTVNAAAWKAAEKDVRLLVKEDAALVVDASGDFLTVAGPADFIKRIRAPVEKTVDKIMSQVQRQTEAVQKDMDLTLPMYHMLQQEGLEKARQGFSPDMKVSYDGRTQKLVVEGLPEEILKLRDWILEKKMDMSKKQIDLSKSLLDFLKSLDPLELSQDLFISQGINAILSTENTGVQLLASSPSALNNAETKIRTSLSQQTLVVDDGEVLQRPEWVTLVQQLLDTYNTSKKKTVTIQNHAVGGASILVSGFQNPVEEVSRNLQEFIFNYSRVNETFRLKSTAVSQFITMKKVQEFTTIKDENCVKIDSDPKRPKMMTISGARIHVQNAKSQLQKLTSALATDRLVIDKPGAKKYFLTQGRMVVSSVMADLNCVVLPISENQEDEEDDEDSGEENVVCHYRVQTASGVLVSVRKANICHLSVDAVVNAANEALQHEGGLALALLKAAGAELQKISDDCIAARGPLRPGDAVATGGCNLPCKYVVHAIGPRYHDHGTEASVQLLKRAVKQSLREVAKLNCTSVALPAISSGVFDFPVRLCANTIAEAVREYCDSLEGPGSLTQIDLVDNKASTVRELKAGVQSVFSDLKPLLTAVQHEGAADAVASGFQEGEGPNHFPGGQGHSGRGAHFAERRGEEEAAGATWAESRGGRSQRPMGSREGDLKQTTAEGLKIVLCKGNIEDQRTCVIVNTIAENLNLNQGAVSKALLQAAGPSLQSAVRTAGGRAAHFGEVLITGGFNLSCQKVFHAICPYWDKGATNAENELASIIRFCLEQAEKLHMQSLSFPAMGTGNLGFPRDLVCRTLLKEIHRFSSRRAPRHLKEVFIVVHPTDAQTTDSFSRQFSAGRPLKDLQDRDERPRAVTESSSQSQQSSVPLSAFSHVSSPSLGIYRMQMGQVALEASSGDITKEASDAIVNSSNHNFNLKSGVSKAILDSAGPAVGWECNEILMAAGNQQLPMILTSAGQLPCKNIVHVVMTNDPTKIKEVVYSVLKLCEENKFSSVAFPALGTGQGRVSPSAVADAMVDAVVDFVRKKQPKFVRSIKILIFQATMLAEFHRSMKKREGEQVQEKGLLNYLKDKVWDFLGRAEEQPTAEPVVLQKEEFEPTVFLLCADDDMVLSEAKKRIIDLIVAEHAVKTIKDQYISQLSQADMDEISALQRQVTVSISLEKGGWEQEPCIHLEGLTRDVFAAEAELRGMLQRVQKAEERKFKAKMLSEQVQWHFQQDDGTMVAFDLDTNLFLEEALINHKQLVKIKISNKPYCAYVSQRRAVSPDTRKVVELQRKDMKAPVPAEWEDMQGSLVKVVKLPVGSPEFKDVEAKTIQTGLQAKIISIERIQNPTLWQSYQLMMKQLEMKNNHKNNERQLFHGTDSNSVDWINRRGFDRGFAGTHAAMYGKGTYFAVDPKYSASGYAAPDLNGYKRMYLARVLVGDYTPGKPGLITPPNKGSANSQDLYDSVTDKATNPTMFIVFADNQAYPEYLITFQ